MASTLTPVMTQMIAALLVSFATVAGETYAVSQCPSPKQYRSFGYVITLLELAKNREDPRARQNKDPVSGRRPPPRGQCLPLRNQPSCFQPSPKGANSACDVGERIRNANAKGANELATKAIVTECDFQGMPIRIANYFEDEAYTHSVQTDEKDGVCRALKVATVMPELNVAKTGIVGQVFLRFLTFLSFYIKRAAKHLFAASTRLMSSL